MVIITKPLSLRLGKSILWPSSSFFSSRRQFYFEIKLRTYLHGVLLSAHSFYTYLRSCMYGGLRLLPVNSPPLLGDFRFTYCFSRYSLLFYFYYDLLSISKELFLFFQRRIQFTSRLVSCFLGCPFDIRYYNYYKFLLYPIFYINRSSELYVSFLKNSSDFYLLNASVFYKKMYFFYMNIVNKLRRFKRNQYFTRLVNVFFTVFSFNSFDCSLVLSALSHELSVLQKRHQPFLRFLGSLMFLLFSSFKKFSGLVGLLLSFKGRLIPYNRQAKQALRRNVLVGNVSKSSNPITLLTSCSTLVVSKFGAVNIDLRLKVSPSSQYGVGSCGKAFDSNISFSVSTERDNMGSLSLCLGYTYKTLVIGFFGLIHWLSGPALQIWGLKGQRCVTGRLFLSFFKLSYRIIFRKPKKLTLRPFLLNYFYKFKSLLYFFFRLHNPTLLFYLWRFRLHFQLIALSRVSDDRIFYFFTRMSLLRRVNLFSLNNFLFLFLSRNFNLTQSQGSRFDSLLGFDSYFSLFNRFGLFIPRNCAHFSRQNSILSCFFFSRYNSYLGLFSGQVTGRSNLYRTSVILRCVSFFFTLSKINLYFLKISSSFYSPTFTDTPSVNILDLVLFFKYLGGLKQGLCRN